MKDPVTISTGITYDRDSIEKWIFTHKNKTCPLTKQNLLTNPELTPNIILRRLIQSWCTIHAVERLPTPKPPVTEPQLQILLNDAVSQKTQIKTLQKLKSIASQNQTNKRIMETFGVHEFLASLIVEESLEASLASLEDSIKVCNEALSILHSLQLSESSLQTLNNGEFIDSLTRVMKSSYESKVYSIMLLKSILELADPSLSINLKPDFFSELAQTLKGQVSEKATKATLKILITTCPWGRNRVKAVESGAVPILIDLLLDCTDKRACEMTIMLLDLLCQCAEGRASLLQHGAGLAIISKKILRVSQVASERAVGVLYSISRFCASPGILMELLKIGVVAKLCLVLQVDCGGKTKERAREMLRSHARAWRNSSCVPNNLISSYPS
ncbi:hypothetical protein BUALT_Bualt11G0090300 [Buddleja alternifolia]|uniref:U-box domain-containing protein n=1 Tax=Buddleja alternifolia TaxID=168488 RepID=A0AAV6X0S1_9LAMI|nr:hypothetical protein BUALT_Bualt11G0090300 [Buddleja alternifolia]